jgi:hypothetical protein
MIRKNADWMVILDERILESLRDDGPSSPAILAASKGVRDSEEKIRRRCDRLEEANLIEDSNDELLTITRKGRQYLDGEIDLGKDDGSGALDINSEKDLKATGTQILTNGLGYQHTSWGSSPA